MLELLMSIAMIVIGVISAVGINWMANHIIVALWLFIMAAAM